MNFNDFTKVDILPEIKPVKNVNQEAIKVKIVNNSSNPLPTYNRDGDACVDLRASFDHFNVFNDLNGTDSTYDIESQSLLIFSGGRVLIDTGLHIQCPEGYMFRIMERSGLSFKGLKVSGGIIDPNYRGSIKVSVINLSDDCITIQHGDRIAQGAIIPVPKIEWEEVDKLDDSDRGSDGFNSSGIK